MATPKKKAPPLGNLPTSGTANPVIPGGKGVYDRGKDQPSGLHFGTGPAPKGTARNPIVGAGSTKGIPGKPVTDVGVTPPVVTTALEQQQEDPTPLPQLLTGPASIPAHNASQKMVDDIINASADPFATPAVAPSGSIGREGIQSTFGDNGPGPQYINNNPDVAPTVLPNNTPLSSIEAPKFEYSMGPTTTMMDQAYRTNEIAAIAPSLAPSIQPALQYSPQALDPSVTGGVVPKAEDNNPLSWLFGDNKTGDLNPLQGNFAGGTGILGAIGYVFGRPPNVAMGLASDVSRGAAAVMDASESSGLSTLFSNGLFGGSGGDVFGNRGKGPDIGKVFQNFGADVGKNFNANSPELRGSPIKSIAGSTEAASFVNQSYTLAGLVGTNDFSFSGVGNRGAGRDVIIKNQFNPFGFSNPFGEFKTDYKDKKTGKTVYLTPEFGTGGANYDKPLSNTWLTAAGLVVDVVTGGKLDKAGAALLPNVLKFARGGVSTTIGRQAAKTAETAAPSVARQSTRIPTEVESRSIVLVPGKGKGPLPPINIPYKAPKGGALVVTPRARTGEIIPYNPTQHSGGAIVPANAPQVVPWGYVPEKRELLQITAAPQRQLQGGADQRMLPPGANPFVQPKVNASYKLDIDYSKGGASIVLVPGTSKTYRQPIITLGADVPSPQRALPGTVAQGTEVQRVFKQEANGGWRDTVVFQAGGEPPIVTKQQPAQPPVNIGKATLTNDFKRQPALPGTAPEPNIRAKVENSFESGVDGNVTNRKFVANPGEPRLPEPVKPVTELREPPIRMKATLEPEMRQLEGRADQPALVGRGNQAQIEGRAGQAQLPGQPEQLRIAGQPMLPGSVVDVTPAGLPNVRVVAQAVPDNIPTTAVLSPTAPGVFAEADDAARANAARLQRIEARKLRAEATSNVPLPASNVAAEATQRPVKAPPVATAPIPTPLRVAPPTEPVNYITAEALSPSLSSGDIVKQLTSREPVPGAVYNPRLVLRQERSLGSVIELARSVELPGGVRILDDKLSDATISNFSRLGRKVDAAIIASGLNPSDPEVSALRRLFQKDGAPLPDNLAPGFSIRVAGRRTDTPASYVKPSQAVDSGYTPRYPLSDDYGLAVRVKQDKAGNIVPSTQADDVVKVLQQPAVMGERVFKSFEPSERAGIVAKAIQDGDTATASIKRAAEDVVNPAVGRGDEVATKVYARENLPKDIVPAKATTETDELLATRHEAHQEMEDAARQQDELTAQLTDIEYNLDEALKYIDTLPDIGKTGTDITLPPAPYVPINKTNSKQVVQSIDDTVDTSRAITDPEVLRKAEDARASVKADKKTGLYKTYTPNPANLPAGTTVDDALTAGIVGRTDQEILDRYALTFKSGAKGRPLSVKSANSAVLDGDAYTHGPKGNISKVPGDMDRMLAIEAKRSGDVLPTTPAGKVGSDMQRMLDIENRNAAKRAAAKVVIPDELFHGTRNSALDLSNTDPLQGAARSEYGTALWLTADEDIARSAASRAVPENIPAGVPGRTLGGDSFIHSVDPDSLSDLNIISHLTPLPRATLHDILDGLMFNMDELWMDEMSGIMGRFIQDSKTVTPAQLFSKLDEALAAATQKEFRQRPTEEELTQIQRIASDVLKAAGIDGVSNGKGIALYNGKGVTSNAIHDISDMVPTNPAAQALEEVNLLSRMAEAEPDSVLLKVQLAEGRARAANYIKQDVMDQMEKLTEKQIRQMDRMLDADERLKGIAIANKSKMTEAAQEADDAIYAKFEKELNKDYTNGCL